MSKSQQPASPRSDQDANGSIDAVKGTCQSKRVIVIDPGHGGTANVPGSSYNNATAVSGVLEKTLTLQFAQSLRTQLKSRSVTDILSDRGLCDLEVLLTRETDENKTSSARVAVARSNLADILVSIHFNGAASASARGTETFYKSASNPGQTNEDDDRALASQVNGALFAALQQLDAGAKNRGDKPDTMTALKSIGVLRDAGVGLSGRMCRSILIEVEFITNVAADALLVSGAHAARNRDSAMLAVAQALARGL